MAPESVPHPGAAEYPLRFGAVAFLFVSVTLVLVLFVMPERYVLQHGFRESGMRFPTPITPFAPGGAVPVPARSLPPGGAERVEDAGPREALWDEVGPLLRAGRLDEALPLLERHLTLQPADADVRRELAVTLLASGRPAAAIQELRALLAEEPNAELSLLLARTLRDAGRLEEASSEYARLVSARPEEESLALEWAQAHAWAGDAARAAEILEAAGGGTAGSVPLRIELARAYHALGRTREALRLLLSLGGAEQQREQVAELEASVLRAFLSRPPIVVEAPSPPSVLEQAMAARLTGQLQRARGLLEEGLSAAPFDPELWLAYADLLEYELGDLDGARAALLEAERLGPVDPALQLRLARIEAWTGRSDAAEARLEALLAHLPEGSVGGARWARADALTLLGDLRRWGGDRVAAARLYEGALQSSATHEGARAGLESLESEVAARVAELEGPGVSATAYSLADSDGFLRVDAGGSWTHVADRGWVLGATLGRRWLQGYDLTGTAALREGVFADVETARWWRWGTLRTALGVGAQRLRTEWDVQGSLSLRHRGADGDETELVIEHAPSYPLANRLQSVLAELVHDRLVLTLGRQLGDRWGLSATFDAARLRPGDRRAFPDSEPTGRLHVALSAGRASSESLTLGVAVGAFGFTRPAPRTAAGSDGRPLFWDPRWSLSAGPYGSLDHELAPQWRLVGRLAPGLAVIAERGVGVGPDVVPHVSLEGGLRHIGSRLTTALELFYQQGQWAGYRSFGARITVGPGGGP